MASEPAKPIDTQAAIKADLEKMFRENGVEATDALTAEFASMLTDSIRAAATSPPTAKTPKP
ncbi:hypothetical protein NLM31_12910 [Bradyrhizobium sp. CCGUVB4N]|uniref:hypothetical protein n=1 Tax=Bradyrhizobium sp. CCGUVB4N TaxID=2949631 RepID=UPI0020B2131A|nr:hypothetical protein [Bradyrhizobium sp. CCGUVB4N]MCP3381240.1 hypothetical protein [Bradyrhizobium sp. CCGUVB4N]